ncbi:MAG: gliding motility-associated C-terminal domain-containing protein [Bacteroidota bacterium]
MNFNKKYLLFFISLTLINLFSTVSKANHIAGGDVSYKCLGGKSYQLKLNFFWDCTAQTTNPPGGIPPPFPILNLASSCGNNENVILKLESSAEISQLCPSQLVNSVCNSGTLPGMRRYTYVTTYTFETCPTGTWTISYKENARNVSNNVPNSSVTNFYVDAQLNLGISSCNNSPFFTSQPIPYVCANQITNYNFGIVENDNDSLRYELVRARSATTSNLVYGGGYSGTAPIPGIFVEPSTGQITFTSPSITGSYIVAIKVIEYDRLTKAFKGYVIRDIQYIVIPCSNNNPDYLAGEITAFSPIFGLPSNVNYNTINGCEGDRFSWKTVYTDIDASDVLTITTNYLDVFAGSFATYSLSGTNPLTVTWELTIPDNAAALTGALKNFTVNVSDQVCPVTGNQYFIYNINASPSTNAGKDFIICGTLFAKPIARGGTEFTWYDLNNVLIPVNTTSFTCNPCSSPTIKPQNIGTYTFVVQSNLTSICKSRDTVVVYVANNFTPTLSQTDSICLGVPLLLDVSPISSATLNYSYSWSPTNGLNNSTIYNPTVTFLYPGTYTYIVSITSNEGCVKTDSSHITVSQNRNPLFAEIIQRAPFCAGGTTNLSLNLGNNSPSTCALSETGLCSTLSTFTSGILSGNSANTNETPFKGSFEDGRMTSLYKASELNSFGLQAGKIAGIKLDVTTKNSNHIYNNFTIKMGCTDLEALSFVFPSNLTQVYTTSYTTTLGINTFTFATPYEWDGISNLLIEICFDNTNWNANDLIAVEATTYPASVSDFDDAASGCTLNTPSVFSNPYNKRPHVVFDWCNAVTNPNTLNFNWTPATGLSTTNISNPTATPPSSPFTYTVNITDKIGGCATSTSKIITFTTPPLASFTYNKNIFCKYDANPIAQIANGSAAGTFSVAASIPSSATLVFANANTGEIDLQNTSIGTYTIKNAYVNPFSACPNAEFEQTIIVTSSEQTSFTYSQLNYCVGSGIISPATNPTLTGTYSANFSGISINNLNGNIDLNSSLPGTYTISYTSTGACTYTSSKQIIIRELPNATLSYIPNYACEQSGLFVNPMLTNTTLAGTYTFPNNLIQASINSGIINVNSSTPSTSIYIVTYTVKNTFCSNSDTAKFEIKPKDNATFNYTLSNTFCKTESNPLPIITGVPNGDFESLDPSLSITNDGKIILENSYVGGPYTIKYTTPNTANSCNSSSTVDVYITNSQSASFQYNNPICINNSTTLSETPILALGNSFGKFSVEPEGLLFSNTSTGEIDLSRTKPGNYTITNTIAETEKCPEGKFSSNISILNPKASFSANPLTGNYPLDVQFFNTSTGATNYAWNFGDANFSNLNAPTHTFNSEGLFLVELTAFANNECFDTDTISIKATNKSFLKIPNVFSPDDDNINKEFTIESEGIADFDCKIFNRWGKKVFESTEVNFSWDGNGYPEGVYFYVIYAKGVDNVIYDKNGTVTLFRK